MKQIKEKETRKLQRINGANDSFFEIKLTNTLIIYYFFVVSFF